MKFDCLFCAHFFVLTETNFFVVLYVHRVWSPIVWRISFRFRQLKDFRAKQWKNLVVVAFFFFCSPNKSMEVFHSKVGCFFLASKKSIAVVHNFGQWLHYDFLSQATFYIVLRWNFIDQDREINRTHAHTIKIVQSIESWV